MDLPSCCIPYTWKVLAAALQPLGSTSAHCSCGGAQWLLTSRQYSIALRRQKPMNSIVQQRIIKNDTEGGITSVIMFVVTTFQ